eukprot:scaffold15_cov152-Isochrysis_galbana.AAC.3
MSISSYASDLSAASHSHSCEITQSNPSPPSGMVQPVVNEMFATVHAAGSSLLVCVAMWTVDRAPVWGCVRRCVFIATRTTQAPPVRSLFIDTMHKEKGRGSGAN